MFDAYFALLLSDFVIYYYLIIRFFVIVVDKVIDFFPWIHVSVLYDCFALGHENQRLFADDTGEAILTKILHQSVLSRGWRRVRLEEHRLGLGFFFLFPALLLCRDFDVDTAILKEDKVGLAKDVNKIDKREKQQNIYTLSVLSNTRQIIWTPCGQFQKIA